MLSIKTMLKLKSLRKKLNSFYWWLVKPLAYIEKCICNRQDKKYELKQIEISKWTDEYAMNLYSKILVKQMVKRSYRYECEEVFVVAEYCDSNYGIRDIRTHMSNQRVNKDLRSWACNLPMYSGNSERIESLTELLKLELEKYKEIKCKYIVDKNKYGRFLSRGYVKTLIVEMNKGDVN